MKETEKALKQRQWEFIELRANGKSYAEISHSIGVSKPTLIAWAKELKDDLANARTLVRDETLSRIAAHAGTRLDMLLEVQMKILSELSIRNLSSVAPEKLLAMHEAISKELDSATSGQHFVGEGDLFPGLQPKETWSA
jgi:hypothetical protein